MTECTVTIDGQAVTSPGTLKAINPVEASPAEPLVSN
jgi:hypothetical protein